MYLFILSLNPNPDITLAHIDRLSHNFNVRILINLYFLKSISNANVNQNNNRKLFNLPDLKLKNGAKSSFLQLSGHSDHDDVGLVEANKWLSLSR